MRSPAQSLAIKMRDRLCHGTGIGSRV